MRDEIDDIRVRGAELAVVGSGRPDQAAAFHDDRALPFDVYVDPNMEAYRAAGLRRGVQSVLSLSTVRNAMRAWRGGHRQGATQGDPWQQGGAFVITPDDEVIYRQVSRVAGDHADPADILAALDEHARGAERPGVSTA